MDRARLECALCGWYFNDKREDHPRSRRFLGAWVGGGGGGLGGPRGPRGPRLCTRRRATAILARAPRRGVVRGHARGRPRGHGRAWPPRDMLSPSSGLAAPARRGHRRARHPQAGGPGGLTGTRDSDLRRSHANAPGAQRSSSARGRGHPSLRTSSSVQSARE